MKVTVSSDAQFTNALPPILVTLAGMVIASRSGHEPNALVPMVSSPSESETLVSAEESKVYSLIAFTFEGIETVSSLV